MTENKGVTQDSSKCRAWMEANWHQSKYVIIRVLALVISTPILIIMTAFLLVFTILRSMLCDSLHELIWLWNEYLDVVISFWRDVKK